MNAANEKYGEDFVKDHSDLAIFNVEIGDFNELASMAQKADEEFACCICTCEFEDTDQVCEL